MTLKCLDKVGFRVLLFSIYLIHAFIHVGNVKKPNRGAPSQTIAVKVGFEQLEIKVVLFVGSDRISNDIGSQKEGTTTEHA